MKKTLPTFFLVLSKKTNFLKTKMLFAGLMILSIVNANAQSNYAINGYYMTNWAGPYTMSNDTPVSGIVSITKQANEATQSEFQIQWDSYYNQWYNINMPFDQVATLIFKGASSGQTNSKFSNSTTSSYYYTTQISGLAYSDRSAVVMQTTNTPIAFASTPVSQYPSIVSAGQAVIVTVTLSGSKSTQELAYVRYSTDNFATSTLAPVTFGTPTASSGTATIPAQVAATAIKYYVFTTTVTTPAVGNSDLVSLKIANNSGSNYSYTVYNDIATADFRSSGVGPANWTTAASWQYNSTGSTWTTATQAPGIGNNVTIQSGHTITLDAAISVKSLTISSGTLDVSSSNYEIAIASGGTFTNSGTFTPQNGTVAFAGTGTVSGIVGFNNITLGGGVDFGSSSTINGTLTINSGGYINTNPPTYANGSTLEYNSTGTYGRGTEWSTTSGAGYPYNVQISNNTALNIGNNGTSTARQCAGNLTVDAGSTFSMNETDNVMTEAVTIMGSIVNNGTITLSGSAGGDIKTQGNINDNGTFNANNRAIFFNGSNTQVIQGTGIFEIPYVIIDKTINSVQLGSNLTCTSLILTSGTLDIAAGKQLTVSTTLTNNGTLNLLSDATGTATITTPTNVSGSGTSNVQQYLSYRSWYLSSPVAEAVTPTLSSNGWLNKIEAYQESDNSWPASTTMAAKTGYLIVPVLQSATTDPTEITFSGTLNNGDISVPLTRTATNPEKPGFNLIGNPYPSYLNWKSVWDFTTDNGTYPNQDLLASSTIWYRSKENGTWNFATVNAAGNVASPATTTATSYIPPMQAFWVKVTSSKTSGELKLSNSMRSHQEISTNKLKTPTNNTNKQLIRLQVSNGANTDETVIYTNENASNGFDVFDSPKMSNDDETIPEIHTIEGTEHLVINGMTSLPQDTEIPVEFAPGSSSSFTIKANEVSNLPSDIKLILKDNATGSETDLSDGTTAYEFTTATTALNRFSVIFKSTGAVTDIHESANDQNIFVYSTQNNQITVSIKQLSNGSNNIKVYNSVGQLISQESIRSLVTTLNETFKAGVYFVIVSDGLKYSIKKVVLK